MPRIHFGVGTGEILDLMGEAGADVVGVDWRVPLSAGIERAGGRAVQGNLDPTLVFAPTEVMLERARQVLDGGAAAPGHIFNLGHGVIPSTDPDQLARLTALRAGALGPLTAAQASATGRRHPAAAYDPPERYAEQRQQHGEGEHGTERGERRHGRAAERVPAVRQPGQEPLGLVGRARGAPPGGSGRR